MTEEKECLFINNMLNYNHIIESEKYKAIKFHNFCIDL